jgi:Hom_end-associated Hint
MSNAKHGAMLRALPVATQAAYDAYTAPGGSCVPPIGDQGQCFPANTPVLMADETEKSIQDVKIGEMVITAEGNQGRVYAVMKRHVNEPLYKLEVQNLHDSLPVNRRTIIATGEHPFLTYNRGYVRLNEIQKDDSVACLEFLKLNSRNGTALHREYPPVAFVSRQPKFDGEVYTILVEGNFSYVANGFGVHNCGNCYMWSGCKACSAAQMTAGIAKPGSGFMLSVQCMLDTYSSLGGCNGGDEYQVCQQIQSAGCPSVVQYPGAGQSPGPAQPTANMTMYSISSIVYCDPNQTNQGVASTQSIKNAILAYGYVSVAVAAGSRSDGTTTIVGNDTSVDHAVGATGWDDAHDNGDGSKGAFVLDNQWGSGWGTTISGTPGRAWIKYGADAFGTEAFICLVNGPPVPPGPPTPPPVPPVPPTPPTPPTPGSGINIFVPTGTPDGQYTVISTTQKADLAAKAQAIIDALGTPQPPPVVPDLLPAAGWLRDTRIADQLATAMTKNGATAATDYAKVRQHRVAHDALMLGVHHKLASDAQGKALLADYSNGQLPAGWLTNLLNWFITNGPALLNLIQEIMKMFGLP